MPATSCPAKVGAFVFSKVLPFGTRQAASSISVIISSKPGPFSRSRTFLFLSPIRCARPTMSSCLPCYSLSPEATQLNHCYPPSKQLLNAAPEFKPLSQELSRFCYTAANKPGKLNKIGEELEKRVQKEALRAKSGYAKSRASLLISLSILRTLISECKRDLPLFARSIIRIVDAALTVDSPLSRGTIDLEVAGRAGVVFTAYTTYSETSNTGIDDSLTSAYAAVVKKFAAMAMSTGPVHGEKVDTEMQNRTRLLGLAALNGASSSDAMFSSNSEFDRQISIIVPALLINIEQGTMDQLKLETAKIEMDASPSPYFSEFSARPPLSDRRAPSLHAHINGEKGPSSVDVLSAALRSLHALVKQCHVTQSSHLLEAVFQYLDSRQGVAWNDVERCCWLAERLTAFTMLQYRFVVPTKLLELLSDLPDDKPPSSRHLSLLAMTTTVLNSKVSLVGLAISDLLTALVNLIVRRVRVDLRDPLLPPLVLCVRSLATHVYYADQVNDIIEELAGRISDVAAQPASRLKGVATERDETLRVLVTCIISVMTAVDRPNESKDLGTGISSTSISTDKGKQPQVSTPVTPAPPSQSNTGRRNKISPEVWQETLPLLCESSYAVRSTYARALLLYIDHELPHESRTRSSDGPNPTTTGSASAQLPGPSDPLVMRFCNAVHAAVYTLAMSSCLGPSNSRPPSISPMESGPPSPMQNTTLPDTRNGIKEVAFRLTEPTPTATPTADTSTEGDSQPQTPRKIMAIRRASRRMSLPLNRLDSTLPPLSSFDNVATPYDFTALVQILDLLHAAVPIQALTTGAPMLIALDRDSAQQLIRRPHDGRSNASVNERKRAIRELLSHIWITLGRQWEIPALESHAENVRAGFPGYAVIPSSLPAVESETLTLPSEPEAFEELSVEGETSGSSQPLFDPELIIASIATSPNVLARSAMDPQTLVQRFAVAWSVETALRDSVERFSGHDVSGDPSAHLSSGQALMNIENLSYQSFGRPQSRAIDVTDLRDALGNGSAVAQMSSASFSTAGSRNVPDASSVARARSARKPQRKGPDAAEVKDILKDIFRDKKRHGELARAVNVPVALTAEAK